MSVLARLPIMRLIFKSIAPEMELVHAETDLAENVTAEKMDIQ